MDGYFVRWQTRRSEAAFSCAPDVAFATDFGMSLRHKLLKRTLALQKLRLLFRLAGRLPRCRI
jgi:hypothetical protein